MKRDDFRFGIPDRFATTIECAVLSMLFVASSSATELFSETNVTAEVLTNAYSVVHSYVGSAPGQPFDSDAYAQAIVTCDASSPWISTNTSAFWWQTDADKYGQWLYDWSAYRRDVEKHFTVDLRGYTFPSYFGARLAWHVVEFDGTYTTNDLGQPLLLDSTNNTVETPLYSCEWPPFNTMQTLTYSYSTPYPEVWLLVLNWEVLCDMIRTGEDLANIGDPINAVNGNVNLDETDINVPCPGLPLTFRRSYNSVLDYSGPLGPRWTHSMNWLLWETNTVFNSTTNTWKVLQTGDGRRFSFQSLTNGTFSAPADVSWRLVSTNSTYRVTIPGSSTYVFDSNGVLQAISDLWQNSLTMTYTNNYPTNRLVKIEHSNGQFLSLDYGADGVTEVSSPATNLYVMFSYNSDGELTNAMRHSLAGDLAVTYAYDATTNHSLTTRGNAQGHSFQWDYATNVSGQVFSEGVGSRVETNYYASTLTYHTNDIPYTEVKLFRAGTNILYEYYYHPVFRQITDIRGPDPASSNWSSLGIGRLFDHDDYGNTTNEVVYDNQLSEFLNTVREYDGHHNVTNEATGLNTAPSNFWSYTWETNDLVLTSVTDPEGHKVEISYTNASPSMVKVFYDDSNCYTTRYAYTTNGLVSAVTNANGYSVSFDYDSYGRLAEIDPQAGPTVTFSNSILGHVETMTLPGTSGDRVATFDPDELGRVQSITYPDSVTESFSYDALGNLTNHVDRGGRTTRYTYLPTRKLSSVSRVLSGATNTMAFVYDQQFNTLDISDALGRNVESYALDIQDRPTTVTNVEGQTMSVTYGLAQFVKSIERFDDTTVSNAYNGDGWLSAVQYPGATNSFTYFKNGLLKTAGSPLGTITNTYNGANWLTNTVSVSPSGTVSYTYHPAGQVSNAVSVAGSSTYTLDAADRISQLVAPVNTFSYTYSTNNGLVSSMTCTNTGVAVSYTYDILDRLTGIEWADDQTNVLRSFSFAHDAVGMITNLTRETGEQTVYAYDALDRLLGEKKLSSVGAETYDATYTYDAVGNRLTKAIEGITVSYATNYNRLTGWSVPSVAGYTASVDVAGYSSETIGTNQYLGQLYVSNLTAETPSVSTTNFWLDGLSLGLGTQEIVAAIGDAAGNVGYATNTIVVSVVTNAEYHHNTAGCLTNVNYSGIGYTRTLDLSWDGQYQLATTETNGAACESYAYDALGRRAYASDGASTNWLVYDGPHVIAEVDADGTLLKSYTWGPGIDNLLAFTDYTGGETNTYYCLTDHLGTVHALVDESGEIVESYSFDAWGRVLSVKDGDGTPLDESAVGNHYLWQGRWFSWNTGLYYFRARWYDPITGRWLSKDPIGISGGLNQYVFCGNNPVNFVDPSGLRFIYRGKYKAESKAVVERWKRNLPPDARLRRVVEDLDASEHKYAIKQLTGQKDPAGTQIPLPFTVSGRALFKQEPGPANIYIDAVSYTTDGRTWTFPEALAHELLHAHDWLKDDSRRFTLNGHGDNWQEEEGLVTREARTCPE